MDKEINATAVVYVSAISGFEIAIKVARGKLQLPEPPRDWMRLAKKGDSGTGQQSSLPSLEISLDSDPKPT